MLDAIRFYLFLFGVLTIAGGIMGFVKAKSRASLIAGTIAIGSSASTLSARAGPAPSR